MNDEMVKDAKDICHFKYMVHEVIHNYFDNDNCFKALVRLERDFEKKYKMTWRKALEREKRNESN